MKKPAQKTKPVHRLGRHERHALAVLGAVVLVLLVWYAAIWRPATSRLRTARSVESQAAAQVAQDRAQIAQLKADAPEVAAAKAVLGHLTNLVPEDPALDQLLGYVRQAAAEAGVALTDVGTPTPAGWPGSAPVGPTSSAGPTTGGPQSISVSLTVSGSSAAMLQLITDLGHEPRLFVVQTATIADKGGGALTVEAFYQAATSGNPTYPG